MKNKLVVTGFALFSILYILFGVIKDIAPVFNSPQALYSVMDNDDDEPEFRNNNTF